MSELTLSEISRQLDAGFKAADQRFEQFVETYTENHGDVVKRLDKIDTRLDRVEARLGNIDTLLWQGHVIEEMQQRIMRIGAKLNDEKIAAPFVAPPGFAQPFDR